MAEQPTRPLTTIRHETYRYRTVSSELKRKAAAIDTDNYEWNEIQEKYAPLELYADDAKDARYGAFVAIGGTIYCSLPLTAVKIQIKERACRLALNVDERNWRTEWLMDVTPPQLVIRRRTEAPPVTPALAARRETFRFTLTEIRRKQATQIFSVVTERDNQLPIEHKLFIPGIAIAKNKYRIYDVWI